MKNTTIRTALIRTGLTTLILTAAALPAFAQVQPEGLQPTGTRPTDTTAQAAPVRPTQNGQFVPQTQPQNQTRSQTVRVTYYSRDRRGERQVGSVTLRVSGERQGGNDLDAQVRRYAPRGADYAFVHWPNGQVQTINLNGGSNDGRGNVVREGDGPRR